MKKLFVLVLLCLMGCSSALVRYTFIAPNRYVLTDGTHTLTYTDKNLPCLDIEQVLKILEKDIRRKYVDWPKIVYDEDYRLFITGVICARIQN